MKLRPPDDDTLRSLRILERDANYDNVVKWMRVEAEKIGNEAIATKGDDQQRLCGAFEALRGILEYSLNADAILTKKTKK